MAISIYTVNNITSNGENRDEVEAYLRQNCSALFPGGIGKGDNDENGDKWIVLFPVEDEETPMYSIMYGTSASDGLVRCGNGCQEVANGMGVSSIITHIALAPDGLGILFAYGGTVFFGKDSGGRTVVASTTKASSSRVICSDFEESSYPSNRLSLIKTAGLSDLSTAINMLRQTGCPKTLLEPVVFGSGGHSTNLFMTPYTELNISSGWQKVLMSGQEYLYNGLFALKG